MIQTYPPDAPACSGVEAGNHGKENPFPVPCARTGKTCPGTHHCGGVMSNANADTPPERMSTLRGEEAAGHGKVIRRNDTARTDTPSGQKGESPGQGARSGVEICPDGKPSGHGKCPFGTGGRSHHPGVQIEETAKPRSCRIRFGALRFPVFFARIIPASVLRSAPSVPPGGRG